LNLPHDYAIAKYDDIESTRILLSTDLAAIIVEPMQAAGGMIPCSRDFLAFLRQGATDTGAVLIFDEVVTSRLHFGGLQEYHGIYPDMTTLGKWIGGGFPIGAFGGRADIMTKLDPRTKPADGGLSHPGTFNNNVFSMAAGAAACKALTAEKIQLINALGENLRRKIRALLQDCDEDNIQISGFGSLTGLKFLGPNSETLKDLFFFHMLKEGIYVGRRGFLNLSIIHEQRHIDQLVTAIRKFLDM
jgi:glutamate-1-semialdehyde 2,1-aminomutase